MTLAYIDASDKDEILYQFSFRAEWLDILRKHDKIKQAFEKKFKDYSFIEMTLDKNKKTKEIKCSLIKKDNGFSFS